MADITDGTTRHEAARTEFAALISAPLLTLYDPTALRVAAAVPSDVFADPYAAPYDDLSDPVRALLVVLTATNDDRLMDRRLRNSNSSTHVVALPWEDAE